VFYLNTPDMNYRVELFAGYVTDMNSDTYSISFASAEDNQKWLDSVTSQSAFESAVAVKPGDKILTLSTCTYEYDDARFVVLGKMIPIH
jgi:sortase B